MYYSTGISKNLFFFSIKTHNNCNNKQKKKIKKKSNKNEGVGSKAHTCEKKKKTHIKEL